MNNHRSQSPDGDASLPLGLYPPIGLFLPLPVGCELTEHGLRDVIQHVRVGVGLYAYLGGVWDIYTCAMFM